MKNLQKLLGIGSGLATLLASPATWASNVSREVSGWYNDGWNGESHAIYMANDHIFSETNPYWYDLTGTDGSLSERGYAYSAQNVLDAHANGDLIVPSMSDQTRGQIDAVVADATARKRLIANIVATVRTRGYDGIDLNFEQGTSRARASFASFVGELANALHASGKRLEVTMPAATSSKEETAGIFDYAALGASPVDRLKIMGYDNNFDAGVNVPGPVAPISWLRSALTYATITRRVPSSKIRLGLHNYGWTWKRSGSKWQMQLPFDTFTSVEQRSAGSAWKWDPIALESWKEYACSGTTCRSYIGTADTLAARLQLADEFNLAGVALWVLGREDPNVYTRICGHFGSSCKPSLRPALLSLGKPVTASSSFDAYYTPAKAVDGNLVEGWLANPAESTSWLAVDLQAARAVTEVKIYWGGWDWALAYDVETSKDGVVWTTAFHETNNTDGGVDTIAFPGISARFVRVRCIGPKSDGWSYEIYELKVSGFS